MMETTIDPREVVEPFGRMLDEVATPAAIRTVEDGGDWAPMWDAFARSGFLDALVSERAGGAGLSLADAEPLFEAVGAHAIPLPVAETIVARALLSEAGVAVEDGPVVLSGSVADGTVVPAALVAKAILVDRGETLALVRAADLGIEATGIHGDLSARVTGMAGAGAQIVARPEGGLRPLAAVVRAALIAGAAHRLLGVTTAYAGERTQFGKPIGRQQALQQQLAVMAEDAVAVRIAAQLGCAAGLAPRVCAAATAKATASAAAARIAATAHAVFGAIGISADHDLQLFTRRLHEWRFADGSEGYWHRILGKERLSSSERSIDWVRCEIFE